MKVLAPLLLFFLAGCTIYLVTQASEGTTVCVISCGNGVAPSSPASAASDALGRLRQRLEQ